MSGLLDKLIEQQRKLNETISENEEEIEDEKGVNPPSEESQNVCPTCGKFFMRLSMHKCKLSVSKEQRSENAPQLENTKETISVNAPQLENTKENLSENVQNTSNLENENVYNFNLYINIFKQKGNENYYLLDDLLSIITKNMCEQYKVDHWSFLEYGKGKGELTARLERMLSQKEYQNISIFCYTDSQEWLSVSHVLRKNATTIYSGK